MSEAEKLVDYIKTHTAMAILVLETEISGAEEDKARDRVISEQIRTLERMRDAT